MVDSEKRTLFLTHFWLISFVLGLGNTVKSGILSELEVHSNVAAATLSSFAGSLILLGIYDMVHWLIFGPRKKKGIPTWQEGLSTAENWELMGGFLDVAVLGLQVYAVYWVGASLMKVLLCTAEVLTSVIIDCSAGVYSDRGKISQCMIACAIFSMLLGAGIIMYEDWDSPRLNASMWVKCLAFMCPLISGSLRPVVALINASLSRKLKCKIRATEWCIGTATISLVILAIINFYVDPGSWGQLMETAQDSSDWWMFTGGVFTLCNTFGAVALPPLITLGSHYICLTSGQLTMALYLDSIGAFTFEQKPATTIRISATLLSILGALLVSIFGGDNKSNKSTQDIWEV